MLQHNEIRRVAVGRWQNHGLNLIAAVVQTIIASEEETGSREMTAVYIQVPKGYIAFVEELPGANTQGDTLEEARENLREAVQLVMDANRELSERSIAGKAVVREPFALA